VSIDRLQAFAYRPDSINPPTFCVSEYDLTYHRTMGGLTEVPFTCHVFAGRASSDGGQKLLDSYLSQTGTLSVLAALELDKTLGGVCDTLIVESARGAGKMFLPAGEGTPAYYGAELLVRVWAR
jgi:hypothetical protein